MATKQAKWTVEQGRPGEGWFVLNELGTPVAGNLADEETAQLIAAAPEVERLRAALEAIIKKGQTGDYMERAPLVGIALEALGRS